MWLAWAEVELPRSLRTLIVIVLCSLAWPFLAAALELDGVPAALSRSIAVALSFLAFLVVHALPYETNRTALGMIGSQLLKGLRDQRIRRLAALAGVTIGLFAVGIRLELLALRFGGAPAGAAAFVFILAITAVFPRRLFVPTYMIELGWAAIEFPILLVLGSALLLALTASIVFSVGISVSLGMVLVVWGVGFLVEDARIGTLVARSRAVLQASVADLAFDSGESSLGEAPEKADHIPAARQRVEHLIWLGELNRAEEELYRHWFHLSPVDRVRAHARLLLRRRRYKDAIALLDEHAGRAKEVPAVLVSVRALCLMRIGRAPEAAELLDGTLVAKGESNPYLWITRGSCHWYQGEIQNARVCAERARALLEHSVQSSRGRTSALGLALNNRAYYACHAIMAGVWNPRGRESAKELEKAVEDCRIAWKWLRGAARATTADTLGLIRALQGDISSAGKLFRLSLEYAPNVAARNHLAVLYMIGSRNYTRARYLLETNLYEQRQFHESGDPEYTFARHNLDRLAIASHTGISYGRALVFYQTSPAWEHGEEVVRGDAARAKEDTRQEEGMFLTTGDFLRRAVFGPKVGMSEGGDEAVMPEVDEALSGAQER